MIVLLYIYWCIIVLFQNNRIFTHSACSRSQIYRIKEVLGLLYLCNSAFQIFHNLGLSITQGSGLQDFYCSMFHEAVSNFQKSQCNISKFILRPEKIHIYQQLMQYCVVILKIYYSCLQILSVNIQQCVKSLYKVRETDYSTLAIPDTCNTTTT